jgi:multiple sugar transport system ATP-binding protein
MLSQASWYQHYIFPALDFPEVALNNASMARVVLENLTRVFPNPAGPIRALDTLNLSIESGELMTLVGPSGCGKTTLLRIIAGLDKPDSGAVSLDGRVVNDVPPKTRDVAMVFQNPALYPHLSAYDNMAFGLMLRKCPRAEIEKRVKEAAQVLELNGCLDRKPMELSGGQRQRVAIGRAIVRRPGIFLFDEPLSNLDAPLRLQMRAELRQLHQKLGATMFYVTHEQVEAMSLGNRIAVMQGGQIQQVASAGDLYAAPVNRFVAGFIGSPLMNFFEGRLLSADDFESEQSYSGGAEARAPGFRLRLSENAANVLCKHVGKSIVLGLRAEHITLQTESDDSCSTIEAEVEWVQSLGQETHVHLAISTHKFVARVPGNLGPDLPKRLKVRFLTEHAHFFDPVTGKAIR